MSDSPDALEKFLSDHGSDLLRWDRGTVVIESYFEKQFTALGGNMNSLIACFEDNGNMEDTATEYLHKLSEANPPVRLGQMDQTSRLKAELTETIGLVRAVRRFVGNYERFAPETSGYIGEKRRAMKRIENALIDCLRIAIEELHEGNKGDRIRATEAEIATLENHHWIDEPIRASGKIQSLAENFLREGSREIADWGNVEHRTPNAEHRI